MKSTGMPFAMWLLFEKSFKQNLTAVFGMSGKKKFTPKDMDGMKFLPPLCGGCHPKRACG